MNSARSPLDELFRARMIIGASPIGRHYADLAVAAAGVGRLVAAGELDQADARGALVDAAHPLITTKYCGCSRESVAGAIDKAFAKQLMCEWPASNPSPEPARRPRGHSDDRAADLLP